MTKLERLFASVCVGNVRAVRGRDARRAARALRTLDVIAAAAFTPRETSRRRGILAPEPSQMASPARHGFR